MVRAKNEAANIEAALKGLRSQTVELEVVLVDSGSTDGTVEIARPYCDQIVHMHPQDFTFGRSLNLGVSRANGDVLFALSAHCVPKTSRWVEQSLDDYLDNKVAGTFGWPDGPDRYPIHGPVRVTFDALGPDATWGFTNHASSWRRGVWERFPFNEDLASCEDKEWMWRVLQDGWAVVVDPRLIVDTPHRRNAGTRALYRRVHLEHCVMAELVDYPPLSIGQALHKWRTEFPPGSERPTWQRRLNPLRAVEILGEYTGDQRGARARGPHAISLGRERSGTNMVSPDLSEDDR